MAQKDILAVKSIGAEDIVFDMKEFFKDLYSWLGEHKFDYLEQNHTEKLMDNGVKNISLTVLAEKKANEYVKQSIDMEINLKVKKIEVKGKEKQQGSIKIGFQAYLKKDYASEWERPLSRFMREVYDKFFYRSRLAELEGEIVDELGRLIYELKAFLRLEKRVS